MGPLFQDFAFHMDKGILLEGKFPLVGKREDQYQGRGEKESDLDACAGEDLHVALPSFSPSSLSTLLQLRLVGNRRYARALLSPYPILLFLSQPFEVHTGCPFFDALSLISSLLQPLLLDGVPSGIVVVRLWRLPVYFYY